MIRPMIRTLFATLLALAACTDFPELEAAVSPTARNADFPTLAPLDGLINSGPEIQMTEQEIASLQARIARLRARAAALRGPVFDASDRVRLQASLPS